MTKHATINSGFGRESTVQDVLTGVDLAGKTVLLTGGYSGIGLATTKALTSAGAKVLVPARRVQTAIEQLAAVPRVEIGELDLADLASVQRYTDGLLASGTALDHIITMGGTMATPETRVGPGWESQFATNHLGHFALINRLWPALRRDAGSRIVSVSSRGHKFSPIRWGDLQFVEQYDKWRAYGQSKTANVLTAVQLDKLGRGQGIRAYATYPGGVHTPLQRHLAKQEMIDLGWIDEQGNDTFPWKTPDQGAATAVWGVTSAALRNLGGVYLEDNEVSAVDESMSTGVNEWAVDEVQAERLWNLSAELTGVNAFA